MELVALQIFRDLDGWQALAIIVKAATYGASFGAAGGVMFLASFCDLVSEQEDRALRRFIACMASVAIGLSVLRIAVMSGMLSGDVSGMWDAAMTQTVLQSREGIATGLRVASLVIIAVVCRKRVHGIALGAGLFAALVVAISFALVGHASEVAMPSGLGLLPQMLVCLHVLAIAFWLGALWPLHRSTHTGDIANIATIMERFGKLAAIVVSLLIVVGVLLLWLLLVKLEALWGTAYGQLFIVKLLCVALLLALAAMNKLRLTPQLRGGKSNAVLKLRRAIHAEILVAGLILQVTASFTTAIGPAN